MTYRLPIQHIDARRRVTYADGELLPCIGGPYDGETQPVKFPWPGLACPSAAIETETGWYVRDDSLRAWVWKGRQ